MSTTRRVFPEVFKREAVDRVISSGLPVGKVATELGLNESPAIRFSPDEWMTRLYGDDPPAEHFADFCRRIDEQLREVWPRCLELGILDFGCWTRHDRDVLGAKISEIGAQARLYRQKPTCIPEREGRS
jgi:predicted kinase